MSNSDDTILSGIQPSGPLHIGNYLGSLKNFVRLQDEYPGRCFFMIADYHSMTEDFDPKKKLEQVFELAVEFLAAGLNPKKCTIYVQSRVPEVTELAWIFNTITPIAFLERMIQYKDKAGCQSKNINVGLFDYPVLQAADILLLKANLVPVGQDQVQHIELTRDIVGFFNRKFGETFHEPKPLLTKTPRVMSLIDPGKKMSKSLPGSFISMKDEPEEILAKMKKAVTDTGPTKSREMSPGVENLFVLIENFCSKDDFLKFGAAYDDGTIKYSELKQVIATGMADYFTDFRAKRKELMTHRDEVEQILTHGAEIVKKIAEQIMIEVRKKVGLKK